MNRVPTFVVAIPGNHDCDLRQPSLIRNALIEAMNKDAQLASDESVIAPCVVPQSAFFDFRDRVSAGMISAPGKVYYEYCIMIKEQEVLIRCCNTAWVSQNPEVPSRLIYPEDAIPDAVATLERLVVTLLHHPFNWMEPMNGRALRRRVQAVSDIILTGHEHEFAMRQQRDEAGGNAVYIEGVALQGHGGITPSSEFHAIFVDTLRREYRVLPFTWEGKRYEEQHGPSSTWNSFCTNALRAGYAFPLSESMRRRLIDPGITLVNRERRTLSLDDIFVYPDLIEIVDGPVRGERRIIRGETLLDVNREGGRSLITGTDESGKTSLAKRLFVDALTRGLVPILVDGKTARLRGDERDRREIVALFEEQYAATGKSYLDIAREQRVILLDDFASLQTFERSNADVLEYLTHFAGQVLLFSHDVSQHLKEITGDVPLASGRTPFTHFRLLPVSHVRREEMIARYVHLVGSEDPVQREVLRADMRRILSMALGRYYAPSNPVTIIAILQARAFNDQLNLSQSTYGYYYELLIKRALLLNTSHQELDVRIGYLTELAFAVFQAGFKSWNDAWMTDFHERFAREGKLNIKYKSTLDSLIEAGILAWNSELIVFRYDYIFYYFVSRALAARLTSDEGRQHIASLTDRLHEQDPANILLFLTHHTKDAAVIDPMLARAQKVFSDSPLANLFPQTTSLIGLDSSMLGSVYEDRSIEESRRAYLTKLAAADRNPNVLPETASQSVEQEETALIQREQRDTELQEIIAFTNKVHASFKTTQILGQLLKNFPGTLSGDQKTRITEAAYGVSLRTLGALHQIVRNQPEEHAAQIMETIKQDHPDMSGSELLQAARGALHWYMFITSYGVVQRTASDVGTPLLAPVFKEIEDADPTPAIKLISTALRLDRADGFPEGIVEALAIEFERSKNYLALRILIAQVITHFHMFDAPRQVKQRVCELLGITYKPQPSSSPRRLIAS